MLLLEAGEEHAVAATKTYLNSLGAIALLFAAVGRPGRARRSSRACRSCSSEQIALSLETAPPLDEYADAVGATVVARGVNYGTAFEIALKIRELSGLVVEAYSPADLMHGPIAAIRPGWPVIVVAPTGPGAAERRGARAAAASSAARASSPSPTSRRCCAARRRGSRSSRACRSG